MVDLNNLIDPYEIKVRLFPAIFTLSPIILSAYLWYPNLLSLELDRLHLVGQYK